MPAAFPRAIQQELLSSYHSYPVTTILGPRQSGKTTLAQASFPTKPYVNLEAPDERLFAKSDPRRFLGQYPEGAIIDEVQRVPELLSYIQVLVDERKQNGLFVLTGSHQLELQQEITQSLAGRTAILTLYPLSLDELANVKGKYSLNEQMLYGGYPRIYEHQLLPSRFYADYVRTYLERDLKLIINIKDLNQFQRFLYLCAGRTGCLMDYTGLANDLGISRHTVTQWISVLKTSYVIFTLPPYFENFGKQVIKSPKLYFTDVGLLCYLLGIHEATQLDRHPLRGFIFENLVVLELLKHRINHGKEPRMFFYRDSHGLEVDIIMPVANDIIAIEIKSASTFNTDFMKSLIKFKKIASDHPVNTFVIYSGTQEQIVKDTKVINYEHISETNL